MSSSEKSFAIVPLTLAFLTLVNSQSLYHRKIECYSFGEGYFNKCPILDKSSYSVELVRTLENSESCDLGVSYGVIRLQYIWVDKGCKAEFLIKAYGFGGYIDSDAAETSHNKLHVATGPEFHQSKLSKAKTLPHNSARRRSQWSPSASFNHHNYQYNRQGEYPYGRLYPSNEEDVTMSSDDIDVNLINSNKIDDSDLDSDKNEKSVNNKAHFPKQKVSKVIHDPLYRMFHRMKQQGIYLGSNQHINSSEHIISMREIDAKKSKKRVLPDNFAYELNPQPTEKLIQHEQEDKRKYIPRVIGADRYIPALGQENRNWNPKVIDVEMSRAGKANNFKPKLSTLRSNKEGRVKNEHTKTLLNPASREHSEISSHKPIVNFLCPSSASKFDDIERRTIKSIINCGLNSSRVNRKKIGLLLVKQQTKLSAPCVYGRSYGVTKDRLDVWVTDGCKAWFQILY